MYTETQLNSQNKTNLVAIALELGTQLESFKSGPLKGSDVEKKMLDLARQAVNVKSSDVARDQQHTEALAKIEADKELSIKKLELEFADSKGLEAAALQAAYKEIEEKSKLAIDDLSFGLKKAEVETAAKVEELTEKLDAAKAEYTKAVTELQLQLEQAKAQTNLEVDTLNLNHKRDLEQAKYDNKIALRDENLEAAKKIAATHDAVVVDEDVYRVLVATKAATEEELNNAVTAAVKAKSADIYASEGSKFAALKATSESKTALLENDVKYLNVTIKSQEDLITELKEQVKKFPEQLKDAVAAGKADISVNQDAGKK